MVNPLHQLLDKEMDRRQFLAHLGAAIVAMVGLSSVVQALKGTGQQQPHTERSNAPGFGYGPYGR